MTTTPSQGILLETHHAPWRPTTSLYAMQQQQTAAVDGEWIDGRTIKDGSLEFCNDAGAGSVSAFSAQIMVSNALHNPGSGVDGTVLGSAITTLGMINLSSMARWIKVKVTSLTVSGGATLGVRLHAHNY